MGNTLSCMKKISVIIPVYNAQKTIVRALDSVKNQTYSVSEIILINDGSKDQSEEIILKYQREHPDLVIRYVYQENQGPSVARNNGIKRASFEFVTFLDSDDEWLPQKNEKQIAAFEQNPNLSMVGGWREGELDTSINKGALIPISFDRLLKTNLIRPIVMIKKEVFDDVGYFPEDQKYSEDYNLWLRIAVKYETGIVNEVLYSYDNDGGVNYSGLSGNLWGMEKGELRNYKEMCEMGYISFAKRMKLSIISILKYIRRYLIKKVKMA